jgi:hypothetical protein
MRATIRKAKIGVVVAFIVMTALVSCERDFNIELKNNKPQLIVEGYINNLMPSYNYVVLSQSKGFYDPGFENIPVSGAIVTITEGVLLSNNQYQWDETTTRELKEARLPQLRNSALPGFYFDPKLATDSTKALLGKPGKYYLLQIETGGKRYTATTALLMPVEIDSLSSGFYYMDEDEENDTIVEKARITVHYKDPDTIGNTQLHYWKSWNVRNNFGWGGLNTNRYTTVTDELVNGQYIHFTQPNGFYKGDTVHYMLTSVERKVYNFWDSFNKTRRNDGPFATPVTLKNTIEGENVTGCFSGFSVSMKTIVAH